MKILMMTNTFTPHVGGVARSVESFTSAYRSKGHRVVVVAPVFENQPASEEDVVRIPALQDFNGSDFSVVLKTPGYLSAAVERFDPDIIHSHHPFLIGSTALRLSHTCDVPLVFTHHTFFERYTHYVPGDSEVLKRFVVELSTRYANLCDQVFAPSESVAKVLKSRGVNSPIAVVPTGVALEAFERGDGPGFRAAVGIPENAFVVGHLGRLAKEKNLEFLTDAVVSFIRGEPRAHFLVVGRGPMTDAIRGAFDRADMRDRLHLVGVLEQPLLASAYRAMDVFAFSSQSETQGMVLTEAMAASVPVVAVDAPGVREVVVDRHNGRLLASEDAETFRDALAFVAGQSDTEREAMREAALETARRFSMDRSADTALEIYGKLAGGSPVYEPSEVDSWERLRRSIGVEWDLIKRMAGATGAALSGSSTRAPETR
jgi:glycosyltransferase involved in cell wall biosynthesis